MWAGCAMLIWILSLLWIHKLQFDQNWTLLGLDSRPTHLLVRRLYPKVKLHQQILILLPMRTSWLNQKSVTDVFLWIERNFRNYFSKHTWAPASDACNNLMRFSPSLHQFSGWWAIYNNLDFKVCANNNFLLMSRCEITSVPIITQELWIFVVYIIWKSRKISSRNCHYIILDWK